VVYLVDQGDELLIHAGQIMIVSVVKSYALHQISGNVVARIAQEGKKGHSGHWPHRVEHSRHSTVPLRQELGWRVESSILNDSHRCIYLLLDEVYGCTDDKVTSDQ
jgi:hypothetical protein